MRKSTASLVIAITAFSGGNAWSVDAPNASFSLVGHIEQLSVNETGDPVSGGLITVSNIPVVLPKNILVTMPGKYLMVRDLVVESGKSGLALADDPKPAVPFEAEIIGNIVGDQYIAADIRISQGALHQGAGFIQAIDFATGELRIGAKNGTAGARVRLNDPNGVYGLANGSGAKAAIPLDERFELDPENSPVHANTGFPVCVPISGTDSECPASNRPSTGSQTRFTCSDADGGAASPDAPVLDTCDPTKAVPLRVGDYVTYSGILTDAGAGQFIVAAYALEAELGVYTSPGAEPVYIYIEEGIEGTKGEPYVGIDQEETTRFRIVSFTTDPSRPVQVFLADSDRADNGSPTKFKSSPSFTGAGGQTAEDVPLGRVRNTWPAKDNARAVRRDVVALVVGNQHNQIGDVSARLHSLTSGQYVSPISEFIYPEVTIFGVPGYPVSVPTENFCYLATGGGKVESVILTRLDPFPDSGHAQAQQIGTSGIRACDGQ